MPRKSAVERTQRLRRLRPQLDEKVLATRNVVGTMLGLKVVAGELTDEIGLSVFVDRKLPKEVLRPEERLPDSIRVSGGAVPVDVLEAKPMVAQRDFSAGATGLWDGAKKGTLSCLCRSSAGFFGLTCAHAASGADGNPWTPTEMTAWSPSSERYLSVGRSFMALASPGMGLAGDYGFLDAALFLIEHPEMLEMAMASASIPPAMSAAPGDELVADGAAAGVRRGRVLGAERTVHGQSADLVIAVRPPGTYAGDSGMLWRAVSGQPVGIHAYGEAVQSGGSAITTAMLVHRASKRFAVELLNTDG